MGRSLQRLCFAACGLCWFKIDRRGEHHDIYISCRIYKEEGDGYHAFFPDLEMCEADGADLEDAIENARDAAQNWISVELEEFEGDLPFATHMDDIELAENQVAKQIMVKIKFLPDSD